MTAWSFIFILLTFFNVKINFSLVNIYQKQGEGNEVCVFVVDYGSCC